MGERFTQRRYELHNHFVTRCFLLFLHRWLANHSPQSDTSGKRSGHPEEEGTGVGGLAAVRRVHGEKEGHGLPLWPRSVHDLCRVAQSVSLRQKTNRQEDSAVPVKSPPVIYLENLIFFLNVIFC